MDVERTSDLSGQLLALRGSGPEGLRNGSHSLRPVAEVNGVEYVDDTRGTFLDASLLSILDLGKPLVWIVDATMAPALDGRIQEFMRDHVDCTVFFGRAGTAAIEALDAGLGCVYGVDDLRTAVFTARELASPGGKVLFSPACPSAKGAANQTDLSAVFKRAVMDL